MGTAALERSITESLYTKKPGALKSLVIAVHTKTLFYHRYIYCTSTHELAAKYSSVIHLERNLTWSYNYLHKQGVESFLRLQHHSLFLDLELNTKKSFSASLSLSLSLSLCLSRSLCLLAQVAYGCLESRFWYVDGLMFSVGKLTKRKATGKNREPRKRRSEELPGKVIADFFGKHCRNCTRSEDQVRVTPCCCTPADSCMHKLDLLPDFQVNLQQQQHHHLRHDLHHRKMRRFACCGLQSPKQRPFWSSFHSYFAATWDQGVQVVELLDQAGCCNKLQSSSRLED